MVYLAARLWEEPSAVGAVSRKTFTLVCNIFLLKRR